MRALLEYHVNLRGAIRRRREDRKVDKEIIQIKEIVGR